MGPAPVKKKKGSSVGKWILLLLALLVVPAAYLANTGATFVREDYGRLMEAVSMLDIDAFTGETASFTQQAQVVATDRLTGASKFPIGTSKAVALEWRESKAVAGLRTTQVMKSDSLRAMAKVDPAKTLVVGSIRMGFGHHRIAYAMSSWGLTSDLDVYFHDLLSIDSAESSLIKETDAMYRKSSTLATEYGGPFEWFHGMMTSSGDATSLRSTALIGARLAPLLRGLPPDAPVIASHSLVALAAAVAGSKTVLNLVIDNHPQWFVAPPKALNLVQGPRDFIGFARMMRRQDTDEDGYSVDGGEALALAGHWIPHDLVTHLDEDAEWRKGRAKTPGTRRTVLIPMGGAGAQKKFITGFIQRLAPLVVAGKLRLVVNAGDHATLVGFFKATLEAIGPPVEVIATIDEARSLTTRLRADSPDVGPLVLMGFDDYFAAIASTDILVRGVDVLAVKPSELAFYPVPKLFIRRVGDHEKFSADRANELGDGTQEARTVDDAVDYVNLFMNREPLATMNQAIINANKNGAYDGCKTALALVNK